MSKHGWTEFMSSLSDKVYKAADSESLVNWKEVFDFYLDDVRNDKPIKVQTEFIKLFFVDPLSLSDHVDYARFSALKHLLYQKIMEEKSEYLSLIKVYDESNDKTSDLKAIETKGYKITAELLKSQPSNSLLLEHSKIYYLGLKEAVFKGVSSFLQTFGTIANIEETLEFFIRLKTDFDVDEKFDLFKSGVLLNSYSNDLVQSLKGYNQLMKHMEMEGVASKMEVVINSHVIDILWKRYKKEDPFN